MSALLNWLHMGGYAGYIWPAYSLVFVVFITHILVIKFQNKRIMRMLKRWILHT